MRRALLAVARSLTLSTLAYISACSHTKSRAPIEHERLSPDDEYMREAYCGDGIVIPGDTKRILEYAKRTRLVCK